MKYRQKQNIIGYKIKKLKRLKGPLGYASGFAPPSCNIVFCLGEPMKGECDDDGKAWAHAKLYTIKIGPGMVHHEKNIDILCEVFIIQLFIELVHMEMVIHSERY